MGHRGDIASALTPAAQSKQTPSKHVGSFFHDIHSIPKITEKLSLTHVI